MKEIVAEVSLRKLYQAYRVGNEYDVERNVRQGIAYEPVA